MSFTQYELELNMPVISLTAPLVRATKCPPDKGKLDLFDSKCKGLLFEVRASGGRTWYLRYSDARGKQHQYRIANADDMTLPVARKVARDLRARIALGHDPAQAKEVLRTVPTFADFMTGRYFTFVKGYKRSWANDESYFRIHLMPALGHKHLDQITRHDVMALHHGMRANGYKAGTANRALVLLKYALGLALRWEVPGVTKNPAKDVALLDDFNKKERFLSEQEARALYQSVQQSDNPLLRYIVPLLILTGARKREVLDARWSDFDLPGRLWRIPITKSGKPRHVPISDEVLNLLASVPRDDSPWVFANPKTGKPYVTIYASWNTARKAVGLADVRVHDLRHSFASFLVNAGRTLYEVQKILGHSQVSTTQRYAHLSKNTLLEAANVVPFSIQTLPIRVN